MPIYFTDFSCCWHSR